MDNSQFNKMIQILESQNKKLDQVVDILKSIDKKTLEPNGLDAKLLKIQEKSKADNDSFLKNVLSAAAFTKIATSLDNINELLKSKLK